MVVYLFNSGKQIMSIYEHIVKQYNHCRKKKQIFSAGYNQLIHQ